MKRRDILKSSAIILGYAVTGGAAIAVMNGCKADRSDNWKPVLLSEEQVDMLAEVVETILPTTDTPGAKAALVHRYIDEAISNNWNPEEREKFMTALPQIDLLAQELIGKPFVRLDEVGRNRVIASLAKAYKASGDDEHIFKQLRDLTVTGYFTSEIGATQALVFDSLPGPYKGCIPVSDVGGTYAL